MSLFGSDIEKKCKEAAADGEPQWEGAGIKIGLQVWRIEKFKVKPWPKSKYGSFHEGDSYIILHTYMKPENPGKLLFDVHFWIGSESTQDEYGTAAYKTVELDDKLEGAAVQHREVQGHETDLFCSYFRGNRLIYLHGGVESGFQHVEAEVHQTKLFQMKGKANNLRLKQVRLSRESMNSGDVFILDAEAAIYQWNGAESNAYERAKAAELCTALKGDRTDASVVVLSEGIDDSPEHPMWAYLPGESRMLGIKIREIKVQSASKGGEDDGVHKFTPLLMRLRISAGHVHFSCAGKGEHLPVSMLRTSNVYLYDTGFHVYLWVGQHASQKEKVSAFPFAQKYLKEYKRPSVLTITRYAEGKEHQQFLQLFGPPNKGCLCAVL
eukprot:CAMPEP_0119327412 /NCGR_PEP_ID=MMETSP1333-20130426/70738_1 /TAXON_ID=418940 /ORGANISM="Scyphosphaera apsteinii, Strain RCC1455" /LENGTH=380 /DNA_ID=CAMNT_0007335993 /DNA_START=163 /DNA_END=1305 /DNA_ORIENTATION=-